MFLPHVAGIYVGQLDSHCLPLHLHCRASWRRTHQRKSGFMLFLPDPVPLAVPVEISSNPTQHRSRFLWAHRSQGFRQFFPPDVVEGDRISGSYTLRANGNGLPSLHELMMRPARLSRGRRSPRTGSYQTEDGRLVRLLLIQEYLKKRSEFDKGSSKDKEDS